MPPYVRPAGCNYLRLCIPRTAGIPDLSGYSVRPGVGWGGGRGRGEGVTPTPSRASIRAEKGALGLRIRPRLHPRQGRRVRRYFA